MRSTLTIPDANLRVQGGKFLAAPSSAGYLHWRLYPNYRIYADLQMSLFTDYDIYTTLSMNRSKNSLSRTLESFKPDYLAIEHKNVGFPNLIEGITEYAPVFFDDRLVLYANRLRNPDLVEKYEMKWVNPFSPAKLQEGVNLDAHLEELKRILVLFPESDRVNHAITRLLFNAKRYQEALPWAKRFIEYHPDNPNSQYLLGNIYENSGACDRAIEHYQKAMAYSDEKFKRNLKTQIGSCYYLREDFASAYRYLWAGLNPFSNKVGQEDLYQLAFSAFVVGETEESILLLKMLLHESPAENIPVVEEARKLLQKIEQEGDDTLGFLEWLWERAKGILP